MAHKTCSKCNVQLGNDEKFCTECGTKYERQESSSIHQEDLVISKSIQDVKSGHFIYKAVTFDSYMIEVMGDRRKEFAFQMSASNTFAQTADYLNVKITGLVNDLFNYYGKQGWEYWNCIDVPVSRIREIAEMSGNSKSALSFMAAGLKAGLKEKITGIDEVMPAVFTHYIFRKFIAD